MIDYHFGLAPSDCRAKAILIVALQPETDLSEKWPRWASSRRVGAERQRLLLACEPIAEAPELAAGRSDEEVEVIGVAEFVIALSRLCLTNAEVGKHCWYRDRKPVVDTSSDTSRRPGCQRTPVN